MKFKLVSLFLVATAAHATQTSGTANPFRDAKAVLKADGETKPLEFFTDDEKSVRFELSFQSAVPDTKFNFVLVQMGENNLIERYFGVLNDEGMLGDAKKSDKIFSRKVQFKERKSRTLRFAVFYEAGTTNLHKGDAIPSEMLVPIQPEIVAAVQGRPSFLQVVSKIWNNLTGSSN